MRIGSETLAVAFLLVSGAAEAFPSMIRHQYTSCTTCHADPSGAGLLTEYGRAQADLLVRFRPQATPPGTEPEVGASAGFLFGAVKVPDWLLISGNLRGGALITRTPDATGLRPVQMASDLRAQATAFERLRLNGSIGYSIRGAAPAAVTPGTENTLVSREHWVGVDLRGGEILLRAGRMNLPFGLRNVEHTSWVRSATRTDINTSGQHGLAAAYNGEKFRGELMAIAGNFQISPDFYRERGYSAFVEYAPLEDLAVGLSSLVTTVRRDILLRRTTLRHAHGAFVRYGLSKALSLLGEADVLILRPSALPGDAVFRPATGYVAFVQGDYEVLQGLHLVATLEALDERREENGPSLGAWASVIFFFAPHSELRLDATYRHIATNTGPRGIFTLLTQVHFFL